MVWVRGGWFDTAAEPPVTTVFGHTPTAYIARLAEEERLWLAMDESHTTHQQLLVDNPPTKDRIWRAVNRIAIDCGCAYSGNLAALCLETGDEIYVPSKIEW